MNRNVDNEALEKALRKLKTGDRFETEIRAALGEYDVAVVDRVVATLKEKRILNDRRTAEEAVARASRGKPIGRERLRQSLLARGAAEEVVSEALEGYADEAELARQALAGRFGADDSPGKAGRYLISRGFDEDTVRSALESFFGSSE